LEKKNEGEVIVEGPSFFIVKGEPIKVHNFIIVDIQYNEKKSHIMSYLPKPRLPTTSELIPQTEQNKDEHVVFEREIRETLEKIEKEKREKEELERLEKIEKEKREKEVLERLEKLEKEKREKEEREI